MQSLKNIMDKDLYAHPPKDTICVGFLSNFEVFEFFKEKKERQLNTITYEAFKYLHGTPCAVQTKDALEMFMNLVQPFGLTKTEKLTILNTRPTHPVEIQAIVEESEERLTEEQLNDLLDIIQKTLVPISEEEMSS